MGEGGSGGVAEDTEVERVVGWLRREGESGRRSRHSVMERTLEETPGCGSVLSVGNLRCGGSHAELTHVSSAEVGWWRSQVGSPASLRRGPGMRADMPMSVPGGGGVLGKREWLRPEER